jgi:hypothetical protein
MRSFEKNLKTLLKLEPACDGVFFSSNLPLTNPDLKTLAALKLVDLHDAGDDAFYATLTDEGRTYFIHRSIRRRTFIAQHLATFLGGFLSGVFSTIAATWIVSRLR